MRVGFNFHTTDTNISGVEYYSLGLLNSLVQTGINDQFVVFTNQPELVKKHVIAADNLIIEHVPLKTRIQRILWEHLQLPKLLQKHKIDILHCPHYICPVFKSNVPYVVTIHDTIALDHPCWCTTSNALYYNIFMRLSFRYAARIVTVSNSTDENITYRFKGIAQRAVVIHPGIDSVFGCLPNPSLLQQIRSKYHLPEKFILFVGNIEPKKNIAILLQAYKILQKKGIPHKLVLVGKRTWKSIGVFRNICCNFGPDDIILTGYVDRNELPFIYKMASAFVFVSLEEGFGFPAIEAMASGTPVVASATGILKEVAKDVFCFADPQNPRQIAEALCVVLNDQQLRQSLIQKGLQESRRFNWNDTARQTLLLYQDAIKTYE
jgi:glycosyltransferase involved in cell wall biosynthesis